MVWFIIIICILALVIINFPGLFENLFPKKDKHVEKGFHKKYQRKKVEDNPLNGVTADSILEILPTALERLEIQESTFRVLGKNKIIYGRDSSAYELVLENDNNKQIFLEWSEDSGEVEITLWQQQNISPKELSLDGGALTLSNLEKIEGNDDLGEILWKNLTFDFEESCRAKFIENCDQDPERYYAYDFEEVKEGDLILSVEQWGREIEIKLGTYLSPDEINIQ